MVVAALKAVRDLADYEIAQLIADVWGRAYEDGKEYGAEKVRDDIGKSIRNRTGRRHLK
jgi:hypothetical protein